MAVLVAVVLDHSASQMEISTNRYILLNVILTDSVSSFKCPYHSELTESLGLAVRALLDCLLMRSSRPNGW